jgi:hypothetical protein
MLKNIFYIKYLISFLLLSILIIPIFEVCNPYENKPEKECWEFLYIWQDSHLFIFYIIFVLIWVTFLIKSYKFLSLILIVYSLLNLVLIYNTIAFPSPDFSIFWGTVIYSIVSLLLPFCIIVDWFRKKTSAKNRFV